MSQNGATYERPRVQTLHARHIIEMMGPVQGYAGGGERINSTSPVSVLPGGLYDVSPR